jgi:anti-anti-sigma factor
MDDLEPRSRDDGRGLAEIELAEQQGVRFVAVAGEIDIANIGTLEDVTFDLPNDHLGVVIDLSAATYIDSAALGLLFRLRGALQRRGQALRVVCPPACSARRVLDLTGFNIEATDTDRDTAIATIRATVPLIGAPRKQTATAPPA